MKITRKVFVYGNGIAAYRPAAYLKFFLDRPEEYSVFLLTGGFFNGIWKPFRIVLRVVAGVFGLLFSDCLLILPMNHGSPYARLFLRLGKWMGKQTIVDFYISAYETRIVDRKLFGPDSAEAQTAKAQDLAALQLTNKVLFLNRAEAFYYTEVVGAAVSQDKVHVCPLVVPYREQADLPFVEGKAEAMTVAWWGREGNPLHGFEVIAEAIRILVDRDAAVRFALFPAGRKQYPTFREEFRDVLEDSKVFVSLEHSFTNGRLLDYCLHSVDIALGTFGKTKKAQTVLVNKVLDAASMGIPCITQKTQGLLEFFQPNESMLVCEECGEALADAIEEAIVAPQGLKPIGKASRRICRETFSGSEHERRLLTVFSE